MYHKSKININYFVILITIEKEKQLLLLREGKIYFDSTQRKENPDLKLWLFSVFLGNTVFFFYIGFTLKEREPKQKTKKERKKKNTILASSATPLTGCLAWQIFFAIPLSHMVLQSLIIFKK